MACSFLTQDMMTEVDTLAEEVTVEGEVVSVVYVCFPS